MTVVSPHHCAQLVPIFKTLSTQQLQLIDQIVHHHHFATGDFLYQEGDPTTALTIVASGQAKAFQTTVAGKEHLLYLLQTGDIDGEAALFSDDRHYSVSAQALTPTAVCSIERREFQNLLLKYPPINLQVLKALGHKLLGVETRATKANTASVADRLADYLTETAASLDTNQFQLPLKQKDLATFIGTTPETVSRLLARLVKAGAISRPKTNQIKIIDADKLLLE